MHCPCPLLYPWNHHRMGENIGSNVVPERIDVVYYHAQSDNHHLADVWLMCLLYSICGRDRDEWCEGRRRCRSSSSKDTVEEYQCCVSKMKCHNNIKKHPNIFQLLIPMPACWSLEKAAPQFTFPNRGPTTPIEFLSSFFTCLQTV